MHLSAYIKYTLKDRPKGHLGLTGQGYSVGKKDPLTLAQFIATLVRTAVETAHMMSLVKDTEELQAAIEEAFQWCQGLIIEEVPDA